MSALNVNYLGKRSYQEVWDYQKNWLTEGLLLKKNQKSVPQELILVEHPHVYTMGKSANNNNLLVNDDFLKKINAEAFQTERGGDITYHGPGQLVAYPLLDLETFNLGVKKYIFNLEEVIITLLSKYKIKAERIDGKTGIWIDKGQPNERKIAAIGIKCSRHLTIHGLAFNVNTDLSYFNHIVPCGIADSAVTSLAKELGKPIEMHSIIKEFTDTFNTIFTKND